MRTFYAFYQLYDARSHRTENNQSRLLSEADYQIECAKPRIQDKFFQIISFITKRRIVSQRCINIHKEIRNQQGTFDHYR